MTERKKASSARQPDVTGLIADNALLLASAPKREPRRLDLKDMAGKVWASPNTALGLVVGGLGYAVGQANRLRPGDQADPRIRLGHNAVEFIHNPLVVAGAITLGNTANYRGDPYDPNDRFWKGERPQVHEQQHTVQGQQLGPFYLPSNIAGGLTALARDGEWHGPSNWNEVGPKMNPPRPWPARKR
jgi:hypothetical protein